MSRLVSCTALPRGPLFSVPVWTSVFILPADHLSSVPVRFFFLFGTSTRWKFSPVSFRGWPPDASFPVPLPDWSGSAWCVFFRAFSPCPLVGLPHSRRRYEVGCCSIPSRILPVRRTVVHPYSTAPGFFFLFTSHTLFLLGAPHPHLYARVHPPPFPRVLYQNNVPLIK